MAAPVAMAEAAAYAAGRLASALSAGRGSAQGIANLRAAIIAWWACENGWAWPPPRNNPGNIRPGLETARAAGVDAKNFLVFRAPQDGVDAFADLIVRGAPYGGIRQAIASVLSGGDPGLIASAVGSSPWGTSGSCIRGALPNARTASAPAGGAIGATLAVSKTPSATTLADYLGMPGETLLTLDLLRSFVKRAATETGEKEGDLFAFYVDFIRKRLDQIPAPGAAFNDQQFGGQSRSQDPLSAVAGAIAALPGAFGDVLTTLAYLALMLGLIAVGLYVLATSQ